MQQGSYNFSQKPKNMVKWNIKLNLNGSLLYFYSNCSAVTHAHRFKFSCYDNQLLYTTEENYTLHFKKWINKSRNHIIPWLICCKFDREQLGRAFHKYNTSMDARTQSSLVGICFLNLSACKVGRKREKRSAICPFTGNILFTNNISQT